MILAEDLRRRVERALGAPCMLRRCGSEDALFITDYPRRHEDGAEKAARLEEDGFSLREEQGLWLIDPSPAFWLSVIREAPEEKPVPAGETSVFLLSIILVLTRDTVPAQRQPVLLLRAALKALDSRCAGPVLRLFPPAISEYKRKHLPLPEAAGRYLAWGLNHRQFDSFV